MKIPWRALAIALPIAVSACSGTIGEFLDSGSPDSGAMDAGAMDAGAMDAGAMDAGAMDAGAMDAGAMDAGMLPATPVITAQTPVTVGVDGWAATIPAVAGETYFWSVSPGAITNPGGA